MVVALYSRWRDAAGGQCGGRHRMNDKVGAVMRLPGVEHSRDREAGWRWRDRVGRTGASSDFQVQIFASQAAADTQGGAGPTCGGCVPARQEAVPPS